MKKFLATAAATAVFAAPLVAFAYPFGGMIGQIIFCYNNAIYTAVGPPRGGPFIWTPSTRTYQFGPPSHVGQWLLGLAAPPYYCLVSIQPIIVWSGILMTMEGSSGPAAPGFPGGGGFPPTPTPSPTPPLPGSPPPPPSITHVIISEVYPQADSTHGGATADQWLELYNPTSATIDISQWQVRSAQTSQTIPNNTTLPSHTYYVFAGTTQVRNLWNIASNIPVVAFPSAFAGFVTIADHVYLQNIQGTRIDAISWGTDTGAFSPTVSAVQIGHAIVRKNLTQDTDSAQDWIETAGPTPGR